MPSPILAACIAFHILTPAVDGPFFADEVAAVRKAVAARVARLPHHCPARDGQSWVELAASGRIRPEGPRCAAPPPLYDLLRLRGVSEPIRPVLDPGDLTFHAGELMFHVSLPYEANRRWPALIAAAKGFRGSQLGGVGEVRLVGSPVGVAADLFKGWTETDLTLDLEVASAVLVPCHEVGPDPHRSTDYTVVAALNAKGSVTRIEHRDSAGSEAARACVLEKIGALRFPPGATRAVLFVSDRAAHPILPEKAWIDFTMDKAPELIDWSPLYDEPRFHRCALPMGETPFTLQLDATGRVIDAEVPGLVDDVRSCAEEAFRHVAFTCPEGGPGTVEGRIKLR